jgi:hypothetical protein
MHSVRAQAINNQSCPAPYTAGETRLAAAFVLILFAQNPPWPVWDYQIPLVALGVFTGLLLTMKNGFAYFRGGYLGFLAIAGSFIYFFFLHGIEGTFRISSAIYVLSLLLIFRTDKRVGARAFDMISYSFAAVVMVSLVFWVLWQLGLPLPSTSISYGAWKGDDGTTQIDNFYFFVSQSQTLINRFYSVFDEPGVVGTLAAFILCGLRFDFSRRRTWIILAGGLFAWSLAFVVLFIAGIMLFGKGDKLKLFLGIILILAIVAIVLLLGAALPSEDSAGLLLLYRIANFSEYGVSSRTDEKLNGYFFEFISSIRLMFGEGTSFFQERPDLLSGQGAILYLIEYGLLGMVFLLMAYVAVILRNIEMHSQGYRLLLIFLMSFLQRPHMMTPWQIVLFWTILCAWSTKGHDQNVQFDKV